uniref:non-specific serine/threonine protein kinase n=1 Tax=Oryzias latipes TaxID=8090 RepID=A0A3P9L2C9_ORYLA
MGPLATAAVSPGCWSPGPGGGGFTLHLSRGCPCPWGWALVLALVLALVHWAPPNIQQWPAGKASYLEHPLNKRFRGNPAKYVELHPLGEGGCGSVFAGYRKSDHLDVAIKHVPNKYQELSGEVAVMLKLRSGTSHSPSSRAPIALLDWYVLPHELILVLERPMPAVDLQTYVEECRDWFGEKEAKMILKQLVKAAISLQDKKIFHRDIKVENILIDMSSGAPQVRLIDFGVSCFTETHSEYTTFYGTEIHAPPEWWYEHTYSARPTTVWQLGIVLFEFSDSHCTSIDMRGEGSLF